jgi:hypothetical protein
MVVLRDVLGYKLTSVFGYDGSAAISLAIDRGEVDAFINSWSSWVATKRDDLENGVVIPLVQIGPHSSDPMLANVPTADSLAANKSDADKELLGLVELPLLWGYPLLAPPDLPANMLATLRGALAETFADPELVAEATKAGLEVSPVSGEQIQQSMADYMRTPKQAVERLDGLVKADSPG